MRRYNTDKFGGKINKKNTAIKIEAINILIRSLSCFKTSFLSATP